MTKTALLNKISQNLASGSSITAAEHREIENLLVEELFAEARTRADLVAIINANALKPERWYNITDANGGAANIYVWAVAGSALSGLATSKTHPGKVFTYDITTDLLTEIKNESLVWASDEF